MEGRKLDDLLQYFDPKEQDDDLTAQQAIDNNGKPDIRLTRKGKELKAIPASHKTHAKCINKKISY